MNTYFIGKEEVLGYARDFLKRLERFEPLPQVWCPVTKSGDAIQDVLIELIKVQRPELLARTQLLPISVARKADKIKIRFLRGKPALQLKGKSVLLLDGAVHSGHTMNRCVEEVLKHKPAEVISYALVMKAASCFIPTIWGVTIEQTDRAFFLLDEIPNHRLDATSGKTVPGAKKQPPVHIERLADRHTTKGRVICHLNSMDRMTWSDRHFQMQVADHPPCTYVLVRRDKIVAYLTVHFSGDHMSIDEIAVDHRQKQKGYGGVLMRFADTLARQANCRAVQLNAIEDQVTFYKKHDYEKIEGRSAISLDAENYWPMERAVLYHQKLR